jgi:hypothetical protein
MVSCLSFNTVSSVGWYVDSGALRHMTYDKTLFSGLWEQEGVTSVELGDDATYLMREVGSISFRTPLGDVLFVLGLKKILISVSCMVDHQWRDAFEGQHCTINDCSLASPRTLDRGLR